MATLQSEVRVMVTLKSEVRLMVTPDSEVRVYGHSRGEVAGLLSRQR